MPRSDRSQPMPVKHWSRAGLILTYWCNARCACCYLGCSPARREEMSVDEALGYWRGLIEASDHGCRVHLTGGEPFGDWPRLIELCRRAQRERLGPLDKVETNAFWATDVRIVRDRLEALDAAGMGKLVISADPYHQQFVPIRRCRLAAQVAQEVLGPQRVRVRWRDWLADGFDTDTLDEAERAGLFAKYAAGGRDRISGRAAELLAPELQCKSPQEFADDACRNALLRSRHVHVDPAGRVIPGTCAGIILGDATCSDVAAIWQRLDADWAERPVVGTLAEHGPVGLLPVARAAGFADKRAYASKCHLCWDIRRHLASKSLYGEELDCRRSCQLKEKTIGPTPRRSEA